MWCFSWGWCDGKKRDCRRDLPRFAAASADDDLVLHIDLVVDVLAAHRTGVADEVQLVVNGVLDEEPVEK